MRVFILIFFSVTCFAVKAMTKQEHDFYSDPNNYAKPARIMAESYGDLDGDQRPEKIIILDSGLSGDSGVGTGRDLLIYKMENDGLWHLWHASRGPILDTNTGGFYFDPFSSLMVSHGTIVIKHKGGSGRGEWIYTNRYRYQNKDWYLIGLTVYHGAMCDEFMKFNYNLLTGKAIYEQGIELDKNYCGSKSIVRSNGFKKEISLPVKSLPKMDGFSPGENSIKLNDGIDRKIYY